ncbi:MAG: hypothetical protein GY707_01300 [Desulfobacteraceae bacterium]|nr:hypothetical protein [Desulfobacteraceae bacterium]
MKLNFFKILTFAMAIAITMIFVGNGWSDTKKLSAKNTKIQNRQVPNATGTMQLVKKSDPYPSNIYGFECPCKDSVEPQGGILMKGVVVRLRNIKCPGTATTNPVHGKVKFSWHDLKDRRLKFVVKPFTNLRSALNIVMIPPSQTILAAKSSNLIAEIIEINGVKDCNPSNTIRIATCVLEPVY